MNAETLVSYMATPAAPDSVYVGTLSPGQVIFTPPGFLTTEVTGAELNIGIKFSYFSLPALPILKKEGVDAAWCGNKGDEKLCHVMDFLELCKVAHDKHIEDSIAAGTPLTEAAEKAAEEQAAQEAAEKAAEGNDEKAAEEQAAQEAAERAAEDAAADDAAEKQAAKVAAQDAKQKQTAEGAAEAAKEPRAAKEPEAPEVGDPL